MSSRLPPLSTTARSLLAQERERPSEDAALRQRVLERARAALEERPSGVALRLATHSDAAGARGRRWPRALLLAAAAVALAGFAVAGVKLYGFGATDAPPIVRAPIAAAAPAPIAQPQSARATSAEPAHEAASPAEPHRAAPLADPLHASSASTYALELGLLEPARSSIARGDFGGALSAIARHQRDYPRGQLAEEREALRVRALWGMGQKTEAEGLAATFRKRYPRSGLLSWMTATKPP